MEARSRVQEEDVGEGGESEEVGDVAVCGCEGERRRGASGGASLEEEEGGLGGVWGLCECMYVC